MRLGWRPKPLQGRSVRGDLTGLLALHPNSFVVIVVIIAVVSFNSVNLSLFLIIGSRPTMDSESSMRSRTLIGWGDRFGTRCSPA
jgi:hypothetical protein